MTTKAKPKTAPKNTDTNEVLELKAAIELFNADVNANDIDRQKLLNRCDAVDPSLRETVNRSF